MTIRIDNVTVLGTGVLGSQIAYQSAYSGFEVTADATRRPDRFLALHFANELWIRNVAKIMGHPGDQPSRLRPLQLVDIARLNTAFNIAAASDEQAKGNAPYIKEHYIDQGKLGRASGEGFYKYDTASRDRVRIDPK